MIYIGDGQTKQSAAAAAAAALSLSLFYNLAESPTFPKQASFGKYFFRTFGAWSISNSSVASLPAYTIMAFLPPVVDLAQAG